MINKVTLIGNLGRDPEVRRLESGAAVAKFSVATNENYKDKNGEWQTQTEWHDVVVWNAAAERAEKTLKKGSMVYVEGKLTHRSYEDKEGNKRKITEIRAIIFRLLERKENSGTYTQNNFPSEADAPPSKVAEPATSSTEQKQPAGEEADDLPF